MKPAVAESLARQMRRDGEQVPEQLIKEPELRPSLFYFIDVFDDLVHDRDVINVPTSGGGFRLVYRPIKMATLLLYAEFYDIVGDLLDDLLYFILGLDIVYREEVNKD
jgi:hypothetical protein